MVNGVDTTERNRSIATEWFDAFGTFDPAQYEHLVEPDAYYKVGHDEYFGREGFGTIAKIAKFLYPTGANIQVTDMIACGNKVATRVTTRAVTNMGVAYENYYAVHFVFSDDGRIAELYEFLDTAYCHEKFSFEGMEAELSS